MVKNININASYNNQTHLFECNQREFLEKAAEYFNIDIREVELYCMNRGRRRKIIPHDITDLMKIEIVHKKSAAMRNQRTLDPYLEDESPDTKLRDSMVKKLVNNTPLTGQERKKLVEWLGTYSVTFSQKRKIGEISPKPDTSHKKVQVNISITNCKDSFAQTDLVTSSPEEARIQDESISNKIKKLAVHSDVNKKEVASLMRDSFDDRRNFIFLKAPPVSAVKDKYPLLFSLDEVKNELGRIFYAEKCEEFIDNIHKYAPLIIQKCNSSEELYRRTEKSIEHSHTEVQKNYARAVGSVFILTSLMEEQWRFIHLQDYPHGSDDVYPHIDASCHSLKELFFDNLLYRVVVEGQMLCEASNLLEAILCLVASFFIFNIDYPESCRRTLIVFEKLYLNANDTKDLDELTLQMIKLLQLEAKSAQ